MELYQAEWCPHSHAVRQRLTELGVDVALRQVPAEPDDRDGLERVSGDREIPVLVTDDGETLHGEKQILPWLADRFSELPDADAHREQAREKTLD